MNLRLGCLKEMLQERTASCCIPIRTGMELRKEACCNCERHLHPGEGQLRPFP